MTADDPRRVAAVSAAATRLRMDYAAAQVIAALDAEGIPSIVLKGASIARWLYEPADARTYADCDLLVPPHRFRAAVEAATRLGFEPELDERDMPAWWREHAVTAVRSDDGATIDIHRSLPGVKISDDALWSILAADTEPISLGGVTAQTLSEPGRALHAALHAAQHGGAPRDIDVLARAVARLDRHGWGAAAALASALEATAAFHRGLSFLPAGVELAGDLGLAAASDLDVELRAARAPEGLTLARLLTTRGLRARLSFVRSKLFPPATFMRKWSPLARTGPMGLAAAYVWRPIWVATRLPRALRAWSAARDAGSAKGSRRNRDEL